MAAQDDELGADLADRPAIVFAKVRNRHVIRDQAVAQPHHFHIAARLPLHPEARLNPVEIAVNMELQQNRRVIG